jgi:hypothetical protein
MEDDVVLDDDAVAESVLNKYLTVTKAASYCLGPSDFTVLAAFVLHKPDQEPHVISLATGCAVHT